jgi:hypothetical protein
MSLKGCQVAQKQRKLRTATLEEQLARSLEANGSQLHFAELGPKLVPAIPASAVPPKRPPSGGRVPYDVALRQILKTMIRTLDEFGEQWGCEAKQDLVSTLFIAAVKDKRIAFDFDREAA